MNNDGIIWRTFLDMEEIMGSHTLLMELIRAMSTDEFDENIKHIARLHGFDIEEGEE